MIFFKGVNPRFGSKNGLFSNFFFLGSVGQENVFYDILEPKNTFLGYKKKFKKLKNWHFSKGVNPCFWSKNGHFSNFFFFRHYRPGKCVYDILEPNNTFLGYKNEKFKNLKNRHFSMVLVQKWPFVQVFFLGNIGQENVFYDILEPKNTFLVQEWPFFELFLFRQHRTGKFLLRYSRTKIRLSRL